MNILSLFNAQPFLFYSVMGVFGLCIGSFLNVVIYRLPSMLQHQWRQQCQDFLEIKDANTNHQTFNLMWPASHCPHCTQPLRYWHTIPLLSFLVWRGRCAMCQTPIKMRYIIVELITAVLTIVLSVHYGPSIALIGGLIFSYFLIALSFIDSEQQLLPDTLTLPLLWLGLLTSVWRIFNFPTTAIIGAIAGYSSLWLFSYLFTKLTHKRGMGHGDFKLLAALGAWVGWYLLPLVILGACLLGILVTLFLIISKRRSSEMPIAFGPFLAMSGWFSLLWGDVVLYQYMRWFGL